jgi:hypothetical protein
VKRDILEKESKGIIDKGGNVSVGEGDHTNGTGEASFHPLSVTDEHHERFEAQASFLSE